MVDPLVPTVLAIHRRLKMENLVEERFFPSSLRRHSLNNSVLDVLSALNNTMNHIFKLITVSLIEFPVTMAEVIEIQQISCCYLVRHSDKNLGLVSTAKIL